MQRIGIMLSCVIVYLWQFCGCGLAISVLTYLLTYLAESLIGCCHWVVEWWQMLFYFMRFKYDQFFSHHRKKQWFVQFVIHNNIQITVVVWHSGNGVGHISEIALRQAQLVLRWVTVFTTLLCNQPSRLTQPPTLSGMVNEYQPKCGDTLCMVSKDRHGSFHMGWQVKLCDALLTLAIPECLASEVSYAQHKALYKCPVNHI